MSNIPLFWRQTSLKKLGKVLDHNIICKNHAINICNEEIFLSLTVAHNYASSFSWKEKQHFYQRSTFCNHYSVPTTNKNICLVDSKGNQIFLITLNVLYHKNWVTEKKIRRKILVTLSSYILYRWTKKGNTPHISRYIFCLMIYINV